MIHVQISVPMCATTSAVTLANMGLEGCHKCADENHCSDCLYCHMEHMDDHDHDPCESHCEDVCYDECGDTCHEDASSEECHQCAEEHSCTDCLQCHLDL